MRGARAGLKSLPRFDAIVELQMLSDWDYWTSTVRPGVPFVTENNQSYFCPIERALAFFVLYRSVFSREPGLYLYSPALAGWVCAAPLNALPAGQWVRVADPQGVVWPLVVCRAPSGTVTAQWLPYQGEQVPSNAGYSGVSTPSGGTPVTATTALPKLLWHREVRFPNNTGLDLADDEARIRSAMEAREFVINPGSFAGNPMPLFYQWRGRAGRVEKPCASLAECRDALMSAPQQGLIYGRVGGTICFESEDGSRLAAVSVRGWGGNSWATDVQVWQLNDQ